MPHPQHERTRFDNFAEGTAKINSGSSFFIISALFVVVWLPSLFIFSVEASQFFVQTVTAIVTFLLVALLQNSEKRHQEAMNLKLNAIARAVADLMRERAGEDHDLTDNIERLTHTVGLEKRVTTDRQREKSAS